MCENERPVTVELHGKRYDVLGGAGMPAAAGPGRGGGDSRCCDFYPSQDRCGAGLRGPEEGPAREKAGFPYPKGGRD
jgi:hypothetical protein